MGRVNQNAALSNSFEGSKSHVIGNLLKVNLSFNRKLGAKQAHAQMESKESHFNDANGVPVKSSKMIPRISEDEDYTENKILAKDDSSAAVTKDTKISDGNKSDSEVSSPQNIVEQGI